MRRKWVVVAAAIFLAGRCAVALAATQEEVFRSINQNMDSEPDYGHLIPWLCGAAGLVVALVIFRQRQKRAALPRALNHPGKLMKEVARMIDLAPGQMKELKALAKELDCESPLTLMLCPSMRVREESQTEESAETSGR